MKLKLMLATAVAGASIAMGVTATAKTAKTTTATTATTTESKAIELNDVWTAYDAFNTVYLDSLKYIYKNTDHDRAARSRDRGAAAIWCQPMYVDMAINAVNLAHSAGDANREARYHKLLDNLLEGNRKQYVGFDFDNNDLNRGWFIYDDIQWWTITLTRAYMATGNAQLLRYAEKSFARVWYGSPVVGDTGSYADPEKGLGGGMFWEWQPITAPRRNQVPQGKMSCINFPTVVAAMLLHNAAPADRQPDASPIEWINQYGEFSRPNYETKERYLEMAKEIYAWSVENLADAAEPGKIFDNRHGDNASGHPLLYNQGTFIGASVLLYLETGEQQYLDNAIAGADYSIKVLSAEHGLLPWAHNHRDPYNQGSLEQGIYPAIWVQYMRLLIEDCHQTQYAKFIYHNIEEGWANRDNRNICDGESWNKTTGKPMIGSYTASSIPALMLGIFTPSNSESAQ
jgi:hypothetical protein